MKLTEFKWKPQTYYKVKISWCDGNPYHWAILYSGFLERGIPNGYSGIFNPSYDPEYIKNIRTKGLDFMEIVELFSKE